MIDKISSLPFASLRLRFGSRYKIGTIRLSDYLIKYVDSLSTYYGYRYIFNQHKYFFKTSEPKPTIIDAGGYIGLSVLYFKYLYPGAKITVFEPDPRIYDILKQNILNNRLQNVAFHNAALGLHNKTIDLFSDGADGGSLFNLNHAYRANTNIVKVQMVKLSTYIQTPIDLIKMNIEGSEYDVIKEIEDKLFLVKRIIFQYHAFRSLPQTLGRILTILDRHHFQYIVTDGISSKMPIFQALPNNYRHFNLIYAQQHK